MKSAAIHRASCIGAKARATQPLPSREPDDDGFTIKDVFDCVPQATSRSLRHAFEISGWAVKDFFKPPGRNFFNLNVHRTNATLPADLRQARQVIAGILETVGLRPDGDDLLVYQAGDRLVIGLVAVLEDVQESVGFVRL